MSSLSVIILGIYSAQTKAYTQLQLQIVISGGARPWAKGGPGLDLLALSAIFPSVISSFFTQN